jgi:CBS domain-containing protein
MLPLFIASTIGYLLSTSQTIYGRQPLRIDYGKVGLNILGETEGDLIASYQVKDIMIKDNQAIPQSASLQEIAEFVKKSEEPFFPVVNGEYRLCGVISFSEIKHAFFDESPDSSILRAVDLATETSFTITPKSSLKKTLPMFYRNDLDYLPVVDPDRSNRFIGMLSKRDVMKLLKKKMSKKI